MSRARWSKENLEAADCNDALEPNAVTSEEDDLRVERHLLLLTAASSSLDLVVQHEFFDNSLRT